MQFSEHFMSQPAFVKRTKVEINLWLGKLAEYGIQPKIIFDVGANVGVYSVIFAEVAEVYAFEPEPSNYAELVKNIELNGLDGRIKPFNIGFLDMPQKLTMGLPAGADPGKTGLFSLYHTGGVEAEFDNLDRWCEEHQVYPDFMKVDVEGSELQMFSAAPVCLSKVSGLVTEYNSKDKKLPDPEGFRQFLALNFNEVPLGRVRSGTFDILWKRK